MATVRYNKFFTPVKYVREGYDVAYWVVASGASTRQKKAWKAYWEGKSDRAMAIEKEVTDFMRAKTIEAYGSTRLWDQQRFHHVVHAAECMGI